MKKMQKIFRQFLLLVKFVYYKIYSDIMKIDYGDLWIISERGIDARDNGYHFFKYLRENHPDINVQYIIKKTSPDYEKVKNIGPVIEYRSKKHYLAFINAKVLISTHIMGFSPDMGLFTRLNKNNYCKIKGLMFSIKHGITKDAIDINPKINKLEFVVAGAKPEYDFMLEKLNGFNQDNLKYTGFARFDNLISNPRNRILIMPTFRMYDNFIDNNLFKRTTFYKYYNSLLNNKELIDFTEKMGYEIIFYPHIEFQKYLNLFETNSTAVKLANMQEYDVQELLITSKLLVTDYSSVFFDFAYMKKPILYYHFDYNEYRKGHYKEGYFQYDRDGFGKICDNERVLVQNIIGALQNDFRMEGIYLQKISKFFSYNDNHNSQRIYDEIIKKLEK